jgi:hypothetical protein
MGVVTHDRIAVRQLWKGCSTSALVSTSRPSERNHKFDDAPGMSLAMPAITQALSRLKASIVTCGWPTQVRGCNSRTATTSQDRVLALLVAGYGNCKHSGKLLIF